MNAKLVHYLTIDNTLLQLGDVLDIAYTVVPPYGDH